MTCTKQLTNDAISRIPHLNHLTKHHDLHCYQIIHLASRYHISVLSKEYKIKLLQFLYQARIRSKTKSWQSSLIIEAH